MRVMAVVTRELLIVYSMLVRVRGGRIVREVVWTTTSPAGEPITLI